MKQVTAIEISKIVANSPAKHCMLDPAPTWLVKRAMPLLADTLALMCNTSITEGVFPDALKHAIVCPRLKKPTLDPTQLSSYRPISNLSFVSKTVERVVAARFSQHVEAHHLLPCRQSAYRAHHSTETAVIAVHDELVRSIDAGKVCALVLLDLSAAFDTVDHDTLHQVLS
jgi:Reverse transcriptase (RNA-dependent DNA polymerase)